MLKIIQPLKAGKKRKPTSYEKLEKELSQLRQGKHVTQPVKAK